MKDVIAPDWSYIKLGLVEAMMFLRLNMSLIPNNPTYVVKSPIWSTLIPSRLELPNDIDDSDVMKMKKMMMTYQQCQWKVEKLIVRVDFKPFNFLVQ